MLTFKKYLNPIFNNLSKLTDFSNLKPDNSLSEEEYPHLETTVKVIEKQVEFLIGQLNELELELEKYVKIIERETGDDKKDAVKIYNQILKSINQSVRRINIELEIIGTPYFGKVIFNRKASNNFPSGSITSYIGKFAYFDKKSNSNLITDWRAPIANLYYMNSGPTSNVSFTSPAGVQEGDIKQKRMIEISKGRIKNIYDAKTGNSAADEFLLSQLNQKIGQKLTDIVSTIQREQNSIIRDGIDHLTVLQGVAGSGKTTIVLHRLAYLFFSYQNRIDPKKTLIIAPNSLFLDYISGVLPSLGIDGVESNTYLFWAKKLLKWDNRYILTTNKPDAISQKIKISRDFLVKLINGFDSYIESVIQNIPYSRSDLVYKNYTEIKAKSSSISTHEAINLAIEKINTDILIKMNSISRDNYGTTTLNEDVLSKISSFLNQNLNILRLYKGIVENMDIPEEVKRRTVECLKKVGKNYQYETEDLAPLVICHLMLFGVSENYWEYVIADEAQDLSYPQVYSLFMVSKNDNLMLAGDLAQAIKQPNAIDDWIELIDTLIKVKGRSNSKYEYHQLSKCYRTTIEIIDYVTNKIHPIFPSNFLRPEAVLRHGESVEEIMTKGLVTYNEESTEALIKIVRKELDKGRNTVAVITPSLESTTEIYNRFKLDSRLTGSLVPIESDNYSSGVIVLPVIKAKGLEFDTVVITDVNTQNYKYNFDSGRLFYVASTRALHKLYVTYPEGSASRIIRSNDDE